MPLFDAGSGSVLDAGFLSGERDIGAGRDFTSKKEAFGGIANRFSKNITLAPTTNTTDSRQFTSTFAPTSTRTNTNTFTDARSLTLTLNSPNASTVSKKDVTSNPSVIPTITPDLRVAPTVQTDQRGSETQQRGSQDFSAGLGSILIIAGVAGAGYIGLKALGRKLKVGKKR